MKKTAAQLNREIAESLHGRTAKARAGGRHHSTVTAPGKHKGDRYGDTRSPSYRTGWDDAGADTRLAWRKELMDALGDDTLKVAMDALLEGSIERGLKLIHLSGSFEASLENTAFRNSGLTSQQQLEARRSPKLTAGVVNRYKRGPFGPQWQDGYIDRVLDTLEKKVGMRES